MNEKPKRETQNKNTMKPLNFAWKLKVNCIIAVSLLMVCSALAADVARNFTADITAVGPNGDITFVHAPSGYTITARVTEKTDVMRTRIFAPGEIPEGQTVRVSNAEKMDPKKHTVSTRSCSVEQIPEKDLVADVERRQICGKLVHGPVGDVHTNALERRGGDWATADQKTPLELQTADGQRWRLVWATVTPIARQLEKGKIEDLKVGRAAGISIVDQGGGRGELKKATVDVWFEGAESYNAIGRCPRFGSSGETVPGMEAKMDALRQKYAKIKDELARKMPVTFQVVPQLAFVDEPVELNLRALASKEPNSKATLFLDYFHTQMGQKEEINLPWKLSGTDAGLSVYTAKVKLPAPKVGQYLVQWKCDIGGDIEEYSRSYAICDNQSAVCLFTICSSKNVIPTYHKNFVPFDYWTSILTISPNLVNGGPENWTNQSRASRQYGDNPEFSVGNWIDQEPNDVQVLSTKQVKEMAQMLGYPNRPIAGWSYSIGNAAYRTMQQIGDMSATSLCTENHSDGGTEINCWGKPERPYFMSMEDYRKSGPGGPGKLVAFSQLQRHTQLAQHFSCDYGAEGACLGGPLFNSIGRSVFDAIACSRLIDEYGALFQMAKCQKTPYFVCNSVEMDGLRPAATEGNQLVFEYALQKARTENVVFATTAGIAQFYQRHYTSTPESTNYFHDYWAGTSNKSKPNLYPDCMSMEGGTLYALALENQIIPESVYDYTTKWDYPDFGNNEQPRRLGDAMCYMLPGQYDKFAATPKLLDTRPFQANRQDKIESGALVVTVTVEAGKAQKHLPLSLWNLPREYSRSDDWFKTSEKCRFVPVVAPFSGNLNGFLVADVKKGHNVFTLRINSPERNLQNMDFQIGSSLRGKIFTRDGGQMAYIWPSGPWPATLKLSLPAGKTAQAYVAPKGELQACEPGEITIQIPSGQWMRLMGLSRDEILQFASGAHQ